VAESRRWALLLFSYFSTIGIFIAALVICGGFYRRIRINAKNMVICLAILTVDSYISDHFKRIFHYSIDLGMLCFIMSLRVKLMKAMMENVNVTCSFDIFQSQLVTMREYFQNIPLYPLVGAYSFIWYSIYISLNLILILIDWLNMFLQT
ncbi:hypothetical protein PMAYCL1PPCAC_31427, partial [Pristionchus mayeri]